MSTGLTTLIVLDAVLAVVALVLVRSRHTDSEEGMPISIAMLWCLGALLVHFVGVGTFAMDEAQASGGVGAGVRLTVLMVGAASGLVPAVLFAWLFVSAWSSGLANAVIGSRRGLAVDALDMARRLAAEGDIDGALAEYRRVADGNAWTPEPLFAAEGLMEATHRHSDAVALCREIMDRYERDPEAWTRAAQRLVRLYRGPLENPEAASALEHKMAARDAKMRTPGSPTQGRDRGHGRSAGVRIDEAVDALRRKHAQNPGAARPLFEAATLLEREERHDDAAEVLREIARGHRTDERVWCEATHRLAGLMENHLGDSNTATHLLRQIFERAPRSETGHLAYGQLKNKQRGD
ncbi:MAG: hypothetical protein GY851_34625 [bacterium]|nr:hypothetical protein [bacterium]